MKPRALLHSLAFLLLGSTGTAIAQSRSGDYPNLSRRPIETRDFEAETRAAELAASQVQEAAPDADLLKQLDGLSADVTAGQGAFDTSYAAAQSRVGDAGGAAVSSEAWVSAQESLSELEASRNRSVSALASLDTLYINRLNAMSEGKASGGASAIDSLRMKALAVVDSQNDRLDSLRARLRQP